MGRVLVPLPDHDFDTTEVAVPWRYLTGHSHEVVFATERGAGGPSPRCDQRLLDGVIFGRLGASAEARRFYAEMIASPEINEPLAWDEVDPAGFDGLVLAGGHAAGMRQYLESATLGRRVGAIWALGRPVGAICHGVLVLARTTEDGTESTPSVLHGHRTTCLPKAMERAAFWLTAWRLGSYYRTYPAYVEDEVRAALDSAAQFCSGPRTLYRRGEADDDTSAFTCRDRSYLSARWPGDAYLFARGFRELLEGS